MKLSVTVLCLAVVGCGTPPRDVIRPQKTFGVVSPERVWIQGHWEAASPMPYAVLPRATAVDIECRRADRVCDEYIARLVSPDEGAPQGMLQLTRARYEILVWDDRAIVARNKEAVGGPLEVRIDFAARNATRQQQLVTRSAVTPVSWQLF